MVMAGGTGGHVYPALAVADALRARGWEVFWLGTRAGLEARVAPAAGIDMVWISMSGVRGKGLLRKLLLPLTLLMAFWQSLWLWPFCSAGLTSCWAWAAIPPFPAA